TNEGDAGNADQTVEEVRFGRVTVPVEVRHAAAGVAADAGPVGAVERIAAVACPERVLLLVFAADVEVEALVAQIAVTPGRVDPLLAGIAFLRDAERTVEVEALDLALGDDVDHARDRVGAVSRRRAVAQDL